MKVRTLGLCLAVLGVAITASRANAAPAPHCANAWASLPQLNANPAYESPNDPDLTYRDRVVRTIGPYGVWANELGRAARNFVQIRETLAIWSNRLSAAERKFWTDFDADGRVQQSSIDELAYWFHKREVWGNYRANVSASMSQTLGGDAGALTKFLLGGDWDLAFLPPGVVTAGFGPSPQPTIEASFADAAYKTYLTQLLQNSFLRLSECAPRKDGTPSGRVLDQLLRPSYSVDQVRSMWSEVTSWAKSFPERRLPFARAGAPGRSPPM